MKLTTNTFRLADSDIRAALKRYVQHSDPAAAVFEELPLARGNGRADVAAINGSLTGYEIKSERDSLSRLRRQIPLYDLVFDYSYVVVASRHLESVDRLLPPYWGIYCATRHDRQTVLRHIRRSKRNTMTSAAAVVRLMWKTEIVRFLRNNVDHQASGSIRDLWGVMECLPPKQLRKAAREALRARAEKRSVVMSIPYGD
jgi:hypothetical protein